jgi:hypothetical protein
LAGHDRGADEDGIGATLLDILGKSSGEGGAVFDGAGKTLDELDDVG